MKAIIFDRYLDTLGGGERYSLEFALALVKKGYQVEVAWPTLNTISAAEKRFGLDLSTLKTNPQAFDLFSKKSDLLSRFKFMRHYDLIFWVSDGSLPFLFGKRNLVHFQTPFIKIGGNLPINLLKTLFIGRYIYNSKFTQNVIRQQLPLSSGCVLYPPIDIEQFKPAPKKENLILSVARFDSPSHAKRQDILLQAFSLFHAKNKHFKLILAGGVLGESGENQVKELQKTALQFPVEFVSNPSFSQLKSLYAKAKFFWHTAGYGIDEKLNPEKVEHFGITSVEAMSAGCVPIVINRGGQREIIRDGEGFLCETVEEICQRTLVVVEDINLTEAISKKAQERAKNFSTPRFVKEIDDLL